MPRKKKVDQVVSYDGRLYVNSRYTGISHLVQVIDGMRLVQFKGDGSFYILMDEVLAWHEKELIESKGKSGDAEVIKRCKELRAKFNASGNADMARRI